MRVCAHTPVRSSERRSHTDNAHAGRRHGRRRHDRPKYKTASTKYAHAGVRVGGQPKRGARATAQQSSLSSTARCQVTAVGVSTSIFVHARSCKGVLHVFDTSPAPRVGTGCARPLMLTFSIIRMDTSHASPFICSLLKTTYVALSRNNQAPPPMRGIAVAYVFRAGRQRSAHPSSSTRSSRHGAGLARHEHRHQLVDERACESERATYSAAEPKRGARATAQQSCSRARQGDADRRRGVTSIFVHARSCKSVLHVFDTSPAPRVGARLAPALSCLRFSIIRMDTSHASPFICSLLKTTYVALSRNNLPPYAAALSGR